MRLSPEGLFVVANLLISAVVAQRELPDSSPARSFLVLAMTTTTKRMAGSTPSAIMPSCTVGESQGTPRGSVVRLSRPSAATRPTKACESVRKADMPPGTIDQASPMWAPTRAHAALARSVTRRAATIRRHPPRRT